MMSDDASSVGRLIAAPIRLAAVAEQAERTRHVTADVLL